MSRVIFLLAVLMGMATALTTPRSAAAQQGGDRVTIIILDQSGSMVKDAPEAVPPTQASDPHGLRCSAVRLLADLATARDALGLIRLETRSTRPEDLEAQTLVSPPLVMGTRQAREQFKGSVRCDDARHNTPMADALKRAFAELSRERQQRSDPAFLGQILLLTDGAPAPQSERQRREIEQLLPDFAARDWPVHTIGLRLRANGKPEAIALLRAIAARTGGAAFGDVDDPLTLQNIFLQFFAQQTGRSLVPGTFRRLSAADEYPLTVPDYATRSDVLVATDKADATINLLQPGPAFTPVSDTVQGVALVSKDDRYYAAFSVERPLPGAWSVRSDRETGVIVSVLIESDISIRLEDTARVRAANEPLLLEARFYARDPSGQLQPAAIQGADVVAQVTIADTAQELRLRDDGQAPDAVANDSRYSGALPPNPTEFTDLLPAAVTLTARTGAATLDHRATLQLVPIPKIVLTPDALRVSPDQPITARLELHLGRRTVPSNGWQLRVRQIIDGTPEPRELRPDGAGFTVQLTPQDDSRREYALEADLIGTEQNGGLERLRQPLVLSVDIVPALRLVLDDLGPRPVGQPITMTAALLRGFGQPAALSEPLSLQIERAGEVALSLPATAGAQQGIFVYSFTPERAGTYLLRLLPPPDRAVEPVTREIVVAAVPELRLDAQTGTSDSDWRLRSWRSVDGGIYELLGMRRSEQLALSGDVLRDGQRFTGTVSLVLQSASGEILATTAAREGKVVLHTAIPSGTYQLTTTAPGLFAPQIDCCTSIRSIQILGTLPSVDEVWTARGQLASAIVGICLLALLTRYLWLRRLGLVLLKGDRLIFSLDGQERPVDLYTAQGWRHSLWPRHVLLTRDLLQQRVYRGRKPRQAIQPLKVRQSRRLALEINGQPLAASDEQGRAVKVLKDGATVRYAPAPKRVIRPHHRSSPLPIRPLSSKRLAGSSRSRREARPGLWSWLIALLGFDRPRKPRR